MTDRRWTILKGAGVSFGRERRRQGVDEEKTPLLN